jgi:hypothetical protein
MSNVTELFDGLVSGISWFGSTVNVKRVIVKFPEGKLGGFGSELTIF